MHLWLVLAFLHPVNRVESRSSQAFGDVQLSRSHKGESEETKEKESKTKLDVLVKRKMHLKEDYSCNCKDYCPDPKSSELEVSW